MKIVHINDCAGVACMLAVGQRTSGHHSKVRVVAKYDPYGIIRYYGDATILHRFRKSFWAHCLLDVMRADIVHIHEAPLAVRRFRRWSHKIIFHHHGSHSRAPFDARTYEKQAAQIILASHDMAARQYHVSAVHVPNPVDTKLFAPRHIPDDNRGLIIMKPWQTESQTRRIIADMGWDGIEWDIYGRGPGSKRFPYTTMPELLGRYAHYGNAVVNEDNTVDTTVRNITMLQALSLGLKVHTADGVVSGLPEQHRPEVAHSRVLEIYRTVLEGGAVS